MPQISQGFFSCFYCLTLCCIMGMDHQIIHDPDSAADQCCTESIGHGYRRISVFSIFYRTRCLENTIFSTLFYSIAVIFWIVFYRLFHKNLTEIRNTFTTRAWYMISIICAASFVGIFTCVYFSPDTTWYIWPCTFACIITNVGSIRLAAYLADGIHADLERKNLQLQKNYYEELEQNQKQIRKFRHDMNNHLSVVGYLLQKENCRRHVTILIKFRFICKLPIANSVKTALSMPY